MKTIKGFLAFSLGVYFCMGCAEQKTVEIPLKQITGYGPFYAGKSGAQLYVERANDPWKNTQLKISNYPEGWTDVKMGHVDTDIYQTVYQSYHAGSITPEWYEELQQSWNWEPDTLSLSKTPLKTQIAFAEGVDANGSRRMVVDANNNLDFSDDETFPIVDLSLIDNAEVNIDSLNMSSAIDVTYEKWQNNQVQRQTVPLVIGYYGRYNTYLYNFAQYALADFEGNQIGVISDNFTSLSLHKPKLSDLKDTLDQRGKLPFENQIAIHEFIEINNRLYKNRGVNKNKNCLVLERIQQPKQDLISTQMGFKAPAIHGKRFNADSLPSQNGKYLLVDFWATWCGPCLKELPHLKELYAKTDRSKFEIIGIIGDSSPESIEKVMSQSEIDWPQIQSDAENQLKESFGITAYPTTFLIDPNGVIVAKGLRGEALENKILELLN